MSEWKEDAAARRDARHTHDGPRERPGRTRIATRGNRKRWCRGRVGVEHKPTCRRYSDLKTRRINGKLLFSDWRALVCTVCGKELAHYYGGRQKPEWVTD